jgi:hypothetical protein
MKAKILSRLGIEVWKNIPEFESYQVSNLGNVRSLKFNRIKYIKHLNTKGRYCVTLSNDKTRTTNNKISVLMAIVFLNHKPCGHKMVVDHLDNNKKNDRLYNLQIITHRENLSKDKKNKTSKFIGVYFSQNRWVSEIRIEGKSKYLGRFKIEKEASQAYQNELKKINRL